MKSLTNLLQLSDKLDNEKSYSFDTESLQRNLITTPLIFFTYFLCKIYEEFRRY